MRKKLSLLFVVLLAVASTGMIVADCNTYHNSRVIYWEGNAYCGDIGPGCTECTNGGGGSCVTNGSNCTPQLENKN